jgi:hypothetical protein
VILEMVTRARSDGYVGTAWRARCDCGGEWAVRSESLRRGTRQCRTCAGGCQKNVRLNAAAVIRMRELRLQGEPMPRLAAEFRISKSHVHAIVHRHLWRNVA